MREMKRGADLRWPMLLATCLVMAGMLVPILAPPTADAAYPSNFRRHQELYWVWYGPGSWLAASGKNDLHISSPTGTLWNNYGASGVICPQTAGQWFKYLRNNFRNTAGAGQGIYSHPMRGTHFRKIGKIRKLPAARYGPAYFRQKVLWAGRRKGSGQAIRGEMIMDIFAVSGACGQRFQSRGAPARGNAKSIRLLRLVQSTITQRNL
ncbi:MAG: hypothetical protein H6532_06890 [Thermoleophilales bacterium]|nr:hypothetical protein [Thermoleophilales bacterium]